VKFKSVEACFSELREQGFRIYATHMARDAEPLAKADFKGRVAVVVGNESDGVSEQAVDLADRNLLIPGRGLVQSLNVSVAAAIFI